MPDSYKELIKSNPDETEIRSFLVDGDQVSVTLRIPDTLHLDRGYASEALLPELAALERVKILSGPEPMRFGADGGLEDPWW